MIDFPLLTPHLVRVSDVHPSAAARVPATFLESVQSRRSWVLASIAARRGKFYLICLLRPSSGKPDLMILIVTSSPNVRMLVSSRVNVASVTRRDIRLLLALIVKRKRARIADRMVCCSPFPPRWLSVKISTD